MIAEIYSIEIERENLVLGIATRDFEREHRFFDFAFDGLLRRQQRGFNQLLCNCGSAADGALITHEIINRARDTVKIYAGIGVKRRVFGGKDRLFENGGNFFGRNNRVASEVRVENFVEQAAVAVIDFGGLRCIDRCQFLGGRQFVRIIRVCAADQRNTAAHEQQQRAKRKHP